MGGSSPPPPHISVAVGVTVGLLASFVQSLGLTIQRKSHLANEALPIGQRQRDWRRPLWLGGFLIFICSNLFGTIFQIGALPIVVLGPLGAVSLLWNAFFARFILGDEFSMHLVAGIVLIAGGAVLIGIFGVVPEQTHTLDELVRLYTRPPFLIWISLLSFSLAVIIVLAHFAEWALERRIARMYPSAPPLTPRPSHIRRKHNRRWSAPPRPSLPAQPLKSSPALLQGSPDPKYGAVSERRPSSTTTNLAPTNTAVHSRNAGRSAAEQTRAGEDGDERVGGKKATVLRIDVEAKELEAAASNAAIEKSRLILGVAYGGASGTLSGLCLLFAKTGIELLILTVVGQNQFGRVEAWMIVLVLLVAAVLQLFYLNRALRLVGPTLICPLAFCFYNLSSIVSGLIYYDQWDQLSALQFGLVALGTAILLAGVWIVSLKSSVPKEQTEEREMDVEHERAEHRMTDEPESFRDSDSDDSDVEPVEWIPRGLAIGIGAASPGFDIRPAAHHHHRRSRTVTLPTSAVFPTPTFADSSERTHLVDRTASETDLEAAAGELEQRRTSRDGSKSRGFSMSGSMYVGRRDSAPSSPSVGGESNPGLGIAVAAQQPPDSPSGRKRWRKFTPLGHE